MRKQTAAAYRRASLLLTCCIVIMLSASACFDRNRTNVPASSNAESVFDPPVTLRVAYSYSDILLPEGDYGDDNFLTRYIKEQTGVAIRYDWEASGEEDYKSTLDLAIRSNDLPDAFIVNREQFRTLKAQGMLEDLSEIYPKYASALVKEIYDATGGDALHEASEDGKVYAFPNVAIEADTPSYVWIRQDWLDGLKLKPPVTVQDIETIVKAFVNNDPDGNGKDDTVGIPVDRSLIFGEKTGVYGLNSVFASYHAFPKKVDI